MNSVRIGVQLAPQHSTYADFARAVCDVEALGVDTVWNWDHFFPPWKDKPSEETHPDPSHGYHFEAWTLLTAMATLTHRAEIGCLVTCNSYRNPSLLANMAKTVDHISGGRLILGIGAGWCEPEYREYGYQFGTNRERLSALETALPLIKQRWVTELPHPVRSAIPILIGGQGEKIMLRLVAQFADIWNTGGSPDKFKHKNEVLNEWCMKVGRDPSLVERSVNVYGNPDAVAYDNYVMAGAQHIILNLGAPWDLTPVEQLVQWRNSRQQ
jgi:probable F420-dependent oxidoreductase